MNFMFTWVASPRHLICHYSQIQKNKSEIWNTLVPDISDKRYLTHIYIYTYIYMLDVNRKLGSNDYIEQITL
jgi:hypothetical protein